MKVTIEPASTGNIDELFRIERECFAAEAYTREHILSLLKTRSSISLLAKVDDDVAGFVIAISEHRGMVQIGHIITVDVAIKHRRKSIGLMLLKAIENALAKKNIEVVYLEVRSDNRAARRLYQRQGYEETTRLEDYYSAGVHGLRLVKKLKPERDASC